jgi:hypothetical protein
MQQAITLFNRMSEVEKIRVRFASADRLDFLGETNHRSDLPDTTFEQRSAVMTEVAALCVLEFATKGQDVSFTGATWKF